MSSTMAFACARKIRWLLVVFASRSAYAHVDPVAANWPVSLNRRLAFAVERLSNLADDFDQLRQALATEPAETFANLRSGLASADVELLEGKSSKSAMLHTRFAELQGRASDILDGLGIFEGRSANAPIRDHSFDAEVGLAAKYESDTPSELHREEDTKNPDEKTTRVGDSVGERSEDVMEQKGEKTRNATTLGRSPEPGVGNVDAMPKGLETDINAHAANMLFQGNSSAQEKESGNHVADVEDDGAHTDADAKRTGLENNGGAHAAATLDQNNFNTEVEDLLARAPAEHAGADDGGTDHLEDGVADARSKGLDLDATSQASPLDHAEVDGSGADAPAEHALDGDADVSAHTDILLRSGLPYLLRQKGLDPGASSQASPLDHAEVDGAGAEPPAEHAVAVNADHAIDGNADVSAHADILLDQGNFDEEAHDSGAEVPAQHADVEHNTVDGDDVADSGGQTNSKKIARKFHVAATLEQEKFNTEAEDLFADDGGTDDLEGVDADAMQKALDPGASSHAVSPLDHAEVDGSGAKAPAEPASVSVDHAMNADADVGAHTGTLLDQGNFDEETDDSGTEAPTEHVNVEHNTVNGDGVADNAKNNAVDSVAKDSGSVIPADRAHDVVNDEEVPDDAIKHPGFDSNAAPHAAIEPDQGKLDAKAESSMAESVRVAGEIPSESVVSEDDAGTVVMAVADPAYTPHSEPDPAFEADGESGDGHADDDESKSPSGNQVLETGAKHEFADDADDVGVSLMQHGMAVEPKDAGGTRAAALVSKPVIVIRTDKKAVASFVAELESFTRQLQVHYARVRTNVFPWLSLGARHRLQSSHLPHAESGRLTPQSPDQGRTTGFGLHAGSGQRSDDFAASRLDPVFNAAVKPVMFSTGGGEESRHTQKFEDLASLVATRLRELDRVSRAPGSSENRAIARRFGARLAQLRSQGDLAELERLRGQVDHAFTFPADGTSGNPAAVASAKDDGCSLAGVRKASTRFDAIVNQFKGAIMRALLPPEVEGLHRVVYSLEVSKSSLLHDLERLGSTAESNTQVLTECQRYFGGIEQLEADHARYSETLVSGSQHQPASKQFVGKNLPQLEVTNLPVISPISAGFR